MTERKETLTITSELKSDLAVTVKWAKFIAILSFIGIGIMIIAAIFLMTSIGRMGIYGGGIVMGVSYLVGAVVALFPAMFTLNFANKVSKSLSDGDQMSFEDGMNNLKKLYVFQGVMSIIIISLVLLFIIFGVIGAAVM